MPEQKIIQPPITKAEAHILIQLAGLGCAVMNGYQLAARGRRADEEQMRRAGAKLMDFIEYQMAEGVYGWDEYRSAIAKIERLVRATWPETPIIHEGAPPGGT